MPAKAIFPAVVQVNMPVGINVIAPPPVEIGAAAVIFTTAVVPETNAIGVVGAIVVALAIVGAAALTALKLLSEMLVPVAAPITGVTMTILVLVQALMLPLATVPSAGVTNVGLVNSSALVTCLVVPPCTIGKTSPTAAAVATGRDEIAIVAMLVVSCKNVKALTG